MASQPSGGGQEQGAQSRQRGPRPESDDQPKIQHFDLPPIVREKRVDIPKIQQREQVHEIPHVQYIERIEEIKTTKIQQKLIHAPKIQVTERVIEIPKHVKEEQIVEVPQVQIVDKVIEVPQYVIQEKIVEVPRLMLQERIIPIPKRTIEEKIVEIPDDQFDEIIRERVQPPYLPETYGRPPLVPYAHVDDGKYAMHDEVVFDSTGRPVLGPDGRQLIRQRFQAGAPPMGEEGMGGAGMGGAGMGGAGMGGAGMGGEFGRRPVDEVVEIPHIQHIYRSVMQPVLRHVPKPVEVPLTHYKPVPVERVIDRNVPIPVELEVIQEFLCPRVVAKYVEVPVPVAVTRTIEKPIPADAMFNSVIMDAYMSGQPPTINKCTQVCGTAPPTIPAARLAETELEEAGLAAQPSFGQVKSFKSRGWSFGGINIARSRQFLTQQRTLAGKIDT